MYIDLYLSVTTHNEGIDLKKNTISLDSSFCKSSQNLFNPQRNNEENGSKYPIFFITYDKNGYKMNKRDIYEKTFHSISLHNEGLVINKGLSDELVIPPNISRVIQHTYKSSISTIIPMLFFEINNSDTMYGIFAYGTSAGAAEEDYGVISRLIARRGL
ncbi:hypothetical protein LJR153_007281 [Paenibacillus sp. LjRoot153]|uniref:hypothetical protein n=1 Tax=Paenibacillus sp. LjRoot153 TaxID=3342270 RepID=UPI003ECF266A